MQGMASVLHVLISRMQHEVTNMTPSATSATHEEGIRPCKLQQMLEWCHLYCKALSFGMQNIAAGRGSLKLCWFRDLFRSLYMVWTANLFICSPMGTSPKNLSGYQMYSLIYRFVAPGRNYSLEFLPGFQLSYFQNLYHKKIHSTHRCLFA